MEFLHPLTGIIRCFRAQSIIYSKTFFINSIMSYQKFTFNGALTAEQINFFNQNGFIHFEQYGSEEHCSVNHSIDGTSTGAMDH